MIVFERAGFSNAAIFPSHVRDLKRKARDLVVMIYGLVADQETLVAQ